MFEPRFITKLLEIVIRFPHFHIRWSFVPVSDFVLQWFTQNRRLDVSGEGNRQLEIGEIIYCYQIQTKTWCSIL